MSTLARPGLPLETAVPTEHIWAAPLKTGHTCHRWMTAQGWPWRPGAASHTRCCRPKLRSAAVTTPPHCLHLHQHTRYL
jgi:hypothetical protein